MLSEVSMAQHPRSIRACLQCADRGYNFRIARWTQTGSIVGLPANMNESTRTEKACMSKTKNEKRTPVLDPIDRVSEIIFGLIMALTFTGTLSALWHRWPALARLPKRSGYPARRIRAVHLGQGDTRDVCLQS
jgi:hypothetical protein